MRFCGVPYTNFFMPIVRKKFRNFEEVTFLASLDASLLKRYGKKVLDEDWRKLCGIKAKYFDPHWNTAMVGFRPHEDGSERFQLNAYWHIDGDRIISAPLMEVSPNELFYVRFSRWGKKTVRIEFFRENRTFHNRMSLNLGYEGADFWMVNPWYGGQATLRWGMKLWLEILEDFEPQDTN